MTERERESKKKTQLKVASGLFPASFKCFYTFTDVWWHCASQSWAYLPLTWKNTVCFWGWHYIKMFSCMKCGVAQVSALLSATLGPQSFSLSLLFKCVMDLDLYPQGGSVASLASITFLCARFPCCNCLRPWSDLVSTCVCGLGRMSIIFF